MTTPRSIAAPADPRPPIGVACFHGWALDAALWTDIRTALGGRDLHVVTPDRGYFGEPDDRLQGDAQRWIAVGHSLGLLDACMSGIAWSGLVAINGFPQFPDRAGLARMQARLPTSPDAVVRAFRRRCGLAASRPGTPHADRLDAGLHRLATTDISDHLQRPGLELRVLAGTADPIVDRSATEAGFARHTSEIHWIEGGGHLLPLTHPELCAAAIVGLAAELRP